jgi:integrase/recombinase XerD
VARILTAPSHLKSRALLMTIYAAGLRRSEAAHLRVNDIDSARITITVHGKGQKDRVVMLSPVLLEILRQYWRHNKPKQWLFPGENPDYPVNDNDVFTVFHNAVRRAGITKKVSPHSLRQASAYYTTFQSSFSLKTIGLGQVQSAAVYGRSALLRPEPAHLAIVDLFDR